VKANGKGEGSSPWCWTTPLAEVPSNEKGGINWGYCETGSGGK